MDAGAKRLRLDSHMRVPRFEFDLDIPLLFRQLFLLALLVVPFALLQKSSRYEIFPAVLFPAGAFRVEHAVGDWIPGTRWELAATIDGGREISVDRARLLKGMPNGARQTMLTHRRFGLAPRDEPPSPAARLRDEQTRAWLRRNIALQNTDA
jgi:hypothetical protein